MNRKGSGRAIWFVVSLAASLAIVGVILSGCGDRAGSSDLERRIERSLPDILGPADDYRVELRGVSGSRIDFAEILGRHVETDDGLIVSDLELTMDNVRVDVRRGEIEDVGRTRLRARVAEDAVNRYLRRRRPEVRELRVRFSQGLVDLHARPQLLGISGDVDLQGRLQANGTPQVDFIPDRVAIAGIRLPGNITQFLANQVNPIVDLSGLRIPVSVDRVEHRNGSITATGEADIRNLRFDDFRSRDRYSERYRDRQ